MNIEQLALKLSELQHHASGILKEGEIENWVDAVAQQMVVLKKIQKMLLNKSTFTLKNPEAKRILQNIELSEFDDIEEACLDILYHWFDPHDYVFRISEVKALLAPINVPKTLHQFIHEARQCYAFQQFNAVYSLSRTILEAAINDICVRTGRIPKWHIQEDDFRDLSFRDRVEKLVAPKHQERLCFHYHLLCRVIHGSTLVSENESLKALLETLAYVSNLYDVYQHIIKD